VRPVGTCEGGPGRAPAASVADVTDNAHRTRPRLAATLLVVSLAALGCSASGATGSTGATASPKQALRSLARVWTSGHLPADGDGSSPFDTSRPTIHHLDPDLLEAVQAAARDAQDDGVPMAVTSGWRSRAHQQRLLDEAVRKYGSEEEALRYVSTPDRSAHVTGDAVDIGPTEADDWLSRHGTDYGLCQVFANEAWHFELATSPGGECPSMYPDSSYRS
jgi:zinc D-Ala-D-Ala carboxypeptidase